MPEAIRYESFASVLKHSEGGYSQKEIKSLAKSVGVRVSIYSGPYVGNYSVDIEEGTTKTKQKKLLKLLGLS